MLVVLPLHHKHFLPRHRHGVDKVFQHDCGDKKNKTYFKLLPTAKCESC
jgi:hypothetical protein